MNLSSKKITSLSLALLCVFTIWQLQSSHFVWSEIELPEAENFDPSAGKQLEISAEEALYVGATPSDGSLDFNQDQQPDLLLADGDGLSVYLNTRGTEDFIKGPFRPESTAITLDNGFSFVLGEDLQQDGDLDLVVLANPEIEYVKEERTGTVGLVETDYIEDPNAVWGPGELIDLDLKPDIAKEDSFRIVYNGVAGEREHENPFIRVALSEGQSLLDFTAEGAEYSYQAWTPKDAGAPELKVFLNEGQANFKEPEECASQISFEVGTSITRAAAGDFNDDSELDLALFAVGGFTGKVAKYEWEEGNHGRRQTAWKEIFIPSAKAALPDDPGGGFTRPFRASFKIQDYSADFASLQGQQNVFIVPDISQSYIFPVTGIGVENGVSYLESEVELDHVSSVDAGIAIMDSLSMAGRTYAVRIGQEADPIFLKGLGDGCFQQVEDISGEVFEVDYRPKEDDYSIRWTFFRDPTQDFSPEDSLVGARVSFHRQGEEAEDQSYEIAHNTADTIYLDPAAGMVEIEDFLNDANPYIYIIKTNAADGFAYSENKLEEAKLNNQGIPAGYVRRIKNLETLETPIKAAFSDFDQDGDLDFVYANGNLFYKENES